jgi:hypothetical protein
MFKVFHHSNKMQSILVFAIVFLLSTGSFADVTEQPQPISVLGMKITNANEIKAILTASYSRTTLQQAIVANITNFIYNKVISNRLASFHALHLICAIPFGVS